MKNMIKLYEMKQEDVKPFLLSGMAIVTIEDPISKVRYTYKVTKHEGGNVRYDVSLLIGPDNHNDYLFICYFYAGVRTRMMIPQSLKYRRNDIQVKMFDELLKYAMQDQILMSGILNVYHSGKCGKCGRLLTVPSSIKAGLGPICEMYSITGTSVRKNN